MLSDRNREAADRVNEFLGRKPVAFVGAGMTRPHYKGWNELLAQLSADLGIPMDPDLDQITQAEKFYASDRAAYEARLLAIYGKVPDDCRPGLKELVKLNIAAFLTTNYDFSIYKAFMVNGGPEPVCMCYPDLSVSHCRLPRHIMFIHGAVQNERIDDIDNFVLHKTAYLKAYFHSNGKGPGQLMTFLYDVFNQYDVLFIGYGLGREEPLRFALNAAHKSLGREKGRMMLAPAPIATDNRDTFRKEYGIDLVEYDQIDVNHSGLDEIIQHISGTRVINPPRFFSPLSTNNDDFWRTS
jgi:hypothetical protein